MVWSHRMKPPSLSWKVRINPQKGAEWDRAVGYYKTLKTDPGATFDKEYHFKAADNRAYDYLHGTNPGMGVGISQAVPMGNTVDITKHLTINPTCLYGILAKVKKWSAKGELRIHRQPKFNGRIEDFQSICIDRQGKKKPIMCRQRGSYRDPIS